ncbi:MAG TPA: flagellar biosynthesis protein FlhB [Hyphomicrobiales bacterium]|nr:flagellar biosynthesis protein FlhB [Hyphomicrobiales bacterium]
MAEGDDQERSEEPTQKKLDEARRKGDVAKSQEVNNWFLLAGGALALMLFAPAGASDFARTFGALIGNAGVLSADGPALQALAKTIGFAVLAIVGLPFAVLSLAAILGNLVQHGPLWTTEPLVPKLSRISPLAGAGRLFSKQSLLQVGKGVLKLVIVGAALVAALWPERNALPALALDGSADATAYLFSLTLRVFATAVAVLAVLAAVDWLVQRQMWLARQRMSVSEMREEFKQSEGDPQIKARIRRLQIERSRRRMMAKVPEATVVVTNPTHFAVALKWDRGMNAPLCVAKGADRVALRIRALAEENRVPLVENPPLARALYATVELDREIPPEHYRAVAEVIGYVMGLKRRAGAGAGR